MMSESCRALPLYQYAHYSRSGAAAHRSPLQICLAMAKTGPPDSTQGGRLPGPVAALTAELSRGPQKLVSPPPAPISTIIYTAPAYNKLKRRCQQLLRCLIQ